MKSVDPKGNWKKLERDAVGNLVKVYEPRPGGGADYVTEYTYSVLAQLTKVRMERPGMGFNPATVVQERTFVYNNKQRLQSVTHPENGMTSYSYNFDGTMKDKTDAMGQKTQWTYDALGRPTVVQKFRAGGTEELCGKVRYFYDSQNLDSSFAGSNLSARLAAVETGCAAQGGVVQELYSYNVAGAALTKRVRITRASSTVTKDIGYSFDAEGKLATVQYPDVARPFTYFYDSMGRPNRMTGVGWDDSSSTVNTVDHVNGVSYGDGGELLGMTYLQSNPVAQETNRYFVESRSYNSRLQLTRQTTVLNAGATVTDIKYNFSATANDGRIESRENVASGEAVSYQYDSLNRLVRAEQTAGPVVPGTGLMWGLSFVYDGFGNRWDQLLLSGKAGVPSSVQFNQSLNRVSGFSYDANGNTTAMTGASGFSYDVDNRLLGVTAQGSAEQYGYLADNKRFWKASAVAESYYLYGVGGQRILTYTATIASGLSPFATVPKMDVAFGGRVIRANGSGVVEQHRYYPYGEEVEVTTGDRDKFGTYHRDQTGLDYADQRYFAGVSGRFLTPDTSYEGVSMISPNSWNNYAYVSGDPVNRSDTSGLGDENCKWNPQTSTLSCPLPSVPTSPGGGGPAQCTGCSNGNDRGGGDGTGGTTGPTPEVAAILDGSWEEKYGALPVLATQPPQVIGVPVGELTPFAQAVLGQVGQITGSLTTPTPYLAWTGAAVAAGGVLATSGALGSGGLFSLGDAQLPLFRAVMAGELAQITSTGLFQQGQNSTEFGKYFANTFSGTA